MYQFQYAEIIDEDFSSSRERERQGLERSIELLRAAEQEGSHSRAATEALLYVRRLWALLLEDLAKPENDLPVKLRADLISIGLWVLKEAERIRQDESANFKGLIEISSIIREGLK